MQLFTHLLSKVGYFLFFILLELGAIFLIYSGSNFHQTIIGEKMIGLNGYFSSKITTVKSFQKLPRENEILMEENALLKDSLEIFKGFKNFYNPVDSLTIDTLYAQRFHYFPAKIIDYSLNKRNNYFMIDKGSQDGVSPNMAVLSSKGLVGVVFQTTNHYSTILSILHSSTNIKARVKGIDYFGILKWNGEDYRKLQLKEIPKYLNVQKGDTILTAGASAIYPEGHLIGYVSELKPNNKTGNFDIQVSTFDDIAAINNVYVVEDFDRDEINEVKQTDLDVTE